MSPAPGPEAAVAERPRPPGPTLIEASSPNQDDRPAGAPIDMLVLHYTGMRTGAEAIARLRDPAAKVSSHYVVEEDGRIFRLVPEHRRAAHAGISHWRGHAALNARSIGIEIVNPGHEWGYRDFPALQMAAVCDLCLDIIGRHAIPARNVVGHSDVAPDRKQDPGELFDWDLLAAHRLALRTPRVTRPSPFENDGAFFLALERWGYDISDQQAAVRAFQRRWRPHIIDGQVDGECSAILFALLLDRDDGRTR